MSSDQIIALIKKDNNFDVYRVLDAFAGYMHKSGIVGNSMPTYMSHVKSYLMYHDIEINPYKFKAKVSMSKKLIRNDAELDSEQVRKILLSLPARLRLFYMLEMTTLRRPKEITNLRVRDFDFDSKPTKVSVPASIAKNGVEGTTFTTSECTQLLKNYIKQEHLKDDDYLFSSIWSTKQNVKKPMNPEAFGADFRYHLKTNLSGMNEKIEGTERYKIHPYSFKKFGYTRADRKHGKNWADGLKGDKGSPYHRIPLAERKLMYLELEAELTIFDITPFKKEYEAKQGSQVAEIQSLRRELEITKQEKAEEKAVLNTELGELKKDQGAIDEMKQAITSLTSNQNAVLNELARRGWGIKNLESIPGVLAKYVTDVARISEEREEEFEVAKQTERDMKNIESDLISQIVNGFTRSGIYFKLLTHEQMLNHAVDEYTRNKARDSTSTCFIVVDNEGMNRLCNWNNPKDRDIPWDAVALMWDCIYPERISIGNDNGAN